MEEITEIKHIKALVHKDEKLIDFLKESCSHYTSPEHGTYYYCPFGFSIDENNNMVVHMFEDLPKQLKIWLIEGMSQNQNPIKG